MDAIHSLTRRARSPFLNDEHLVAILPKCQQGWEENFRIEGASSIREGFSCQIISSISCKLSCLPEYFSIQLNRFAGNQYLSKIVQFIEFPLRGLDLKPAVHPDLRGSMDMLYECIDIIENIGATLSVPLTKLILSGHYKANVKYVDGDQDAGWIEYNDETLTKYGEEEIVVGTQILLMVSSLFLITMFCLERERLHPPVQKPRNTLASSAVNRKSKTQTEPSSPK